MNKKKVLPNTLDTETLLSQINDSNVHPNEEEQLVYHKDNLLDFLSFYSIKPGAHKVKVSSLYKMYKAWTKENSHTSRSFYNQISHILQTDKKCVLIDINGLNLTLKAKEVFFKPKTSSKVKSNSNKNQIEEFLKQYNIVPGKHAVHSDVLYFIYEAWRYDNYKRVMRIFDFNQIIMFYLPQAEKSNSYYLTIDKQQLNVDGVTLEKAKAWAKTRSEKKKNN